MRSWCTLAILVTLAAAACQPAAPAVTASPNPAIQNPSPQASRTASPPPTVRVPTATGAPALRSFTEGFDGRVDQWSFLQVDNGLAAPDPRTSAGYLRFDMTAANQWLYALYAPQTYTDVRVDGVVAVGGTSGAGGVVCRYSQAAGWYELDVHPDQTYVLLYGKWISPGVARYTPIVRAQSEKIQPAENQVGLQCQGNILTPFINGVQMRQRVENTFALTSGQVGVAAASFESAPMSILVDWVKVSEP